MFGGKRYRAVHYFESSTRLEQGGPKGASRAEAGTPILSGTFGDRAGLMGRRQVCFGLLGSDWVFW
jgi:hypothetical protein